MREQALPLQSASQRMKKRAYLLALASGLVSACLIGMRPVPPATPPTAAQLAELWAEPEPGRDLFWGVGGERLKPDPSVTYKVLEVKRTGFSMGFTVDDPAGRKWSAKLPPEATTEVVASRLLWGVGYHQPPIYYVGRWNAEGSHDKNPQLPARFRETKPDLHGLTAGPAWSYYNGPFVGTREQNGLLVLMAMLGNSDIKDEQNVLYHLKEPAEGASKWYVARDLGQSFGRTGVISAPRGDIKVFEETPFIKGMNGQYVRFDWRGRHGVLLDRITAADVHWIAERLKRLTDAQWQDAFRAGGYAPELAQRFIRRFKQKIEEGLAVGR
jgi:hypothetical protein